MNSKRFLPFVRFVPHFVVAALLLAVYSATLARGLTWMHDGADGGDLITAAARGGVPHPTGYPLYTWIVALFQQLPVGTLAFRSNLFSLLATVAAALLVYEIASRSLESFGAGTSRLAGLASALAFGLSPLIWSQAVITEVYGLHIFLVALLILLTCGLVSSSSAARLDAWTGLVMGLAVSNHVTSLLLLPLVFVPSLRNVRSLARRSIFLALGLLPYLSLPARALSHPPVNWGNPSTLKGFLWLISGALYRERLLTFSIADSLLRARADVTLLLAQFGPLGLFLALLGLIFFFTRSRLTGSLVWIAFGFSAFAILYGTRDSYVYLMPVILCFALWSGVTIANALKAMRRLSGPVVLLLIVLFAWNSARIWPQMDLSHDRAADEFASSVLAGAPQRAILFTRSDAAVFTLWYEHFALDQRTDLVIVASDLLHHDWYQETLRDTYPGLTVPGPFPFEETVRQANPSRPACYIESTASAELNCLPPIDP